MTDRQKQALRKCGIPEAEWAELEATDKRIDRGEKLFDLDPELEAGAKKARQADRKPTERKPREKKQDDDKLILLEQLANAINASPIHAQCEIVNPEREFSFTYNGRKYKVIMSCPRS
jgi:hypothetical protein